MAAPARPRRPLALPPGGLLASAAGFAILALGAMMLFAVLTGTGQLRLGTQASLAGAAQPLLAAPWNPASLQAAAGMGSQAPGSAAAAAGSAGLPDGVSATGGAALQDRSIEGDWGSTAGNISAAEAEAERLQQEAAEEDQEEQEEEEENNTVHTAGGSPAAASGGMAAAATAPSAPAAGSPPADISCSEALGVKKVALLFLTTRRLAHEKLWRLWMWDAARLAPLQAVQHLQRAVCESPAEAAAATWRRMRAACAQRPPELAATPGGAVELPEQHLFSIYVHAPPNYKGLEFQPLFQSRVLPQRLRTWWGTAAITDAERALLAAALRDPANERFVLVSDHGVPLYDPLTTYQQLMAEDRSRVRACPRGSMSIERWNDGMATKRLQKRHWRKSSQFFSLTRRHAEAVVRDREVYSAFKERCDERRKLCVPDEHYIPTLLAVLGLENETYCDGWGVAYTDWSRGGMHPRSFKPREITPALFKAMRWDCQNATEAAGDAERMFVPLDQLLAAGDDAAAACEQLRAAAAAMQGGGTHAYAHPLGGSCPLTARKFPPYTTLRVRQLFLSSCPPGTARVRSKAAATFGFRRDPSLALFRGQACTLGVEKTLGGGAAAGGRGRRLLCALWSAPARWLPLPAALLDACDAG